MKTLKSFVKSKLFSTAGKIATDESGSFAVMSAVTVGLLCMGLCVAVDISNGFSAKQTLQDTTDAIALAAARSESDSPAELTAIAQEYFALKYPGESGATIKLDSITRDGAVVNVVASQVQTTYFAGIFGQSGLDVKVASTAEYSVRDLNLALVLDITGSMGQPTTSGGTKLASLKVAGNDLITQLNESPGEVNVSVVPFAKYVNVGTNYARENWIEFPQTGNVPNDWDGCVGSRQAPLNTRVDSSVQRIPGVVNVRCPETPILPLTQNMNNVRQTINSLKDGGSTYGPAGVAWGWRTLTPTAPFTQASRQDQANTDNVMVIMTDGNNTRSLGGILHEARDLNSADRTMAELCENAKKDGIQIFTIAYEIKDAATQDLLQGCASKTNNFFNASSGVELGDAFSDIAISLGSSRITS